MAAPFSMLLPYRKLSIDTTLSPRAIRQRLQQDVVDEDELHWLGVTAKGYCGVLSDSGFCIRRVVEERNGLLPLVRGTIDATWFGSRVSVRMRPRVGAMIFIGVWFALVLLIGITMWVEDLPKLTPLAMFAFGVGFMHLGFSSEATTAERFLRRALPPHQPVGTGPYR